jgi:hypothetical protein
VGADERDAGGERTQAGAGPGERFDQFRQPVRRRLEIDPPGSPSRRPAVPSDAASAGSRTACCSAWRLILPVRRTERK